MRRWLRGRWRTIALLVGCAGLSFALWVNQDQTDQIGQVVKQQNIDRIESDQASCERGNEIREGIRNLARDLNADAETLAIVDTRFAPVDCASLEDNDG